MIYYNENDRFASRWLKELIKQGYLPAGDVDDRSIEEVQASDLKGYKQCHFFAGIGGWPLAIKQSGWGDRPVWTGSCPCQPFSTAGKRKGFRDDRHLWPVFYSLIAECRPDTIFGEQVASKDAISWLDNVQTDLERESYAVGTIVLPACGFGAPHIRQRLFWVANSESRGWREKQQDSRRSAEGIDSQRDEAGRSVSGHSSSLEGSSECADQQPTRARSMEGRVSDPKHNGLSTTTKPRHLLGLEQQPQWEGQSKGEANLLQSQATSSNEPLSTGMSSPTNGFWGDADWLYCCDNKWRPVEPGAFPLANGVPNRVGKLRGYGNAIVIPAAVNFIESFMECCSMT